MLVLSLRSFHARCDGNHVMVPPTFRIGLPWPFKLSGSTPTDAPRVQLPGDSKSSQADHPIQRGLDACGFVEKRKMHSFMVQQEAGSGAQEA